MSDDGGLQTYVVREGDHLRQLAHRFGLDPDAIWSHPKNHALAALRGDGSILYPGDILYVPSKPAPSLALTAGTTNRYKANVPVVHVDVVFLDQDGAPIADEAYELEGISPRPDAPEPKTDEDGRVTFDVPVHVRQFDVVFPRRNVIFELQVGGMDPHVEASGVRKRLVNLGLLAEGVADRFDFDAATPEDEAALEDALKKLQRDNGKEPTGHLCDETRRLLVDKYGL